MPLPRVLSVAFAVVGVLALGAPLGSTASAREPAPLVVGGEESTGEQYEYLVAVGYKTNFLVSGMEAAHFCGGALVGSTKVVTAAHCLERVTASGIVVATVPSDGRLSSVEEAYTVRSIVTHPEYDPDSNEYDVAVITLNAAVDSGSPLPVITAGELYQEGVSTQIMGWGAVDYDGRTYPDQLIVGSLALVSDGNCSADGTFTTPQGVFYGWGELFLPETMICAVGVDDSGSVVDACNGDSGGPLVGPGPVLFGVVSWGSQKCGFPAPGVYTRLAVVSDFLKDQGVSLGEEPPRDPLVLSVAQARPLPGGQVRFSVVLTGASWEEATGQVRCASRAVPPRRASVSGNGSARVKGLRPGRVYRCVATAFSLGETVRSEPVVVRARR